jgi:hypothetical protein
VMSLKRYAGELQRSEFTQERVMELAIRSSESSRHSKASEPISNQESLR